jgi:hypothetical protein
MPVYIKSEICEQFKELCNEKIRDLCNLRCIFTVLNSRDLQ